MIMKSTPSKRISRIEWRLPDGKLHREDGPAIEWNNGNKEWLIKDHLHRLDGPAVECGDRSWWINGHCVDAQIHSWAFEMNIDLNNLTEDDKVIITMKWSDYGK